MSRFVLTPAAEGDLLKIIEYLEGDNPNAVLKVADALDQAMQRLAEGPGIGRKGLATPLEEHCDRVVERAGIGSAQFESGANCCLIHDSAQLSVCRRSSSGTFARTRS